MVGPQSLGLADRGSARRRSVSEESVKLFVSPASFTSFGPWMLLQHFEAKHEVVNVQVVDDTTREAFAADFSPLIPSVRMNTKSVAVLKLSKATLRPCVCSS